MPPEKPQRAIIFTDAWSPQVNGVVNTLKTTQRTAENTLGHEVTIVGGQGTISLPFYPSIKVEPWATKRLQPIFAALHKDDLIHIATEGPLGWAARNLCLKMRRPFTTSYHTRYPEYLESRFPLGIRHLIKGVAYVILRRFHAPSSAVMVTTPSMARELKAHKFRNLKIWSRGVDLDLYQPYGKEFAAYSKLQRPIMLYVGRVSVEKNLQAFLDADVEGAKVIIGDGPAMASLQHAYPKAHFLGVKKGEDLARHYAAADLFVFPSKTDTFGLVLLEAAASGLRIAAYPVAGPIDIFSEPAAKDFCVLDEDLGKALRTALQIKDDPNLPRNYVKERYSWEACTRQFFEHLQAPTPKAIKRITRIRRWLSHSWQRALTVAFK